ncbi:MAG: sphingosine kinase [Spirochaetaceae bacterium]|nr:MAG: sphingosine kinase [Spirochaetaceae bacterium]
MIQQKQVLVLINPTRRFRHVRRLQRLLRQHDRILEVRVTESKADLMRQVSEFTQSEFAHLLVWGGDGTAHDAINSLYRGKIAMVGEHVGEDVGGPLGEQELESVVAGESFRKAVGFFRGGTGNGIQDSYEVPVRMARQVDTYIEAVKHGYTIDVDLIEIEYNNTTRYAQLIGMGYDAETLAKREQYKEKTAKGRTVTRPGMIQYLVSAIGYGLGDGFKRRTTFNLDLFSGKYAFRGPRVNAEFPFARLSLERSPVMLEIGTRPYYGKMFKVCPDVVCNDGHIDVYVYDFAGRLDGLRNLADVWFGRHSRINQRYARAAKPVIERYEVGALHVSSEKPFRFHADGELLGADVPSADGRYRVSLRVLPRALTFLVPAPFYRLFHPRLEETVVK